MAKHVRFDLITKLILVDKEESPGTSQPPADEYDAFCAEYEFSRRRVEIPIEIPREYFTFVTEYPDIPLTIAERLARCLITIPAIAHIRPYFLPNQNVGLTITRYAYREWYSDVLVPVREGVGVFCDPFTWLMRAS